ncbi:MAG: HAD-IA family hydrolase [Acidobacteriaceae bacterium]|nr:HAD-IA family hydrolase [Acidobacteriaceae bacterium]
MASNAAASRSSSRFSLIVFDLDGTLVDSRRDLAESINVVLASYGCRTHSEEAIGRMVGDGASTLVARAFEASSVEQPPDALQRFLDVYNSRLLRHTRPYPGVPELLDALAQRVPLAVLTNKPLAATNAVLDGLHLSKYFDGRVLGGDGPLPRKPDPAGLAHLIAEAKVTAHDVLMVGDSVVDWQTARAIGVSVCLVRYGFGFDSFPREQLTPLDLVIDEPRDLLSLMERSGAPLAREKSDRPRVLLVDDYSDAREMYREYLMLTGFEVVEAANGMEALDRAVETEPDIILMDLSLPVMDGWEATRRLKADARTARIPVVAITGHVSFGMSEGAQRAGCDAFVTKPCLPEDLVTQIRRLLDRRKWQR